MHRRAWSARGITRRRLFTITTWRGLTWPRQWARCGGRSSSGEIMKKRLILILLIAGIGAALYYNLRGNSRGSGNRIVVSGNIELTEVNIAFKTAGRLIERNVDEGDTVKKGQVLARLDRDQLLAQRDREAASLASAEAQLAQAQTSLEWQKETLAADVEQKKADLSSLEYRLSELENGARPQEKLDAKAAVDSAT